MTPASLNGTDGALLPTGEGRPAGAPGYLQQPALVPLNNQTVTQAVQLNSAFGKNNASYSQEGINGNRDIRLIGRITF